MGRFSVEVELTNYDDRVRALNGDIPPERVRRARLAGVVDSGATRLVLSERVVQALGLRRSGQASVRFADGRMAMREMATGVELRFGDRGGLFTAIVEPGREDARIGAIVLEDLDLLIDCSGQRLVPRDSKQIVSEVE